MIGDGTSEQEINRKNPVARKTAVMAKFLIRAKYLLKYIQCILLRE